MKGVTRHTELTSKEVVGIIDHADSSVTDDKLASGVGLSDGQICKLPTSVEGRVLRRGPESWEAGVSPAGITRLSELEIDTEKDWLWFPINNLGYPPSEPWQDIEGTEGYGVNAGMAYELLSSFCNVFLLMDAVLNTVYRNETNFPQLIMVNYTGFLQTEGTQLVGASMLYVQLGRVSPPVGSIANGGLSAGLRNFAASASQTLEVQGGITFVVPPGWNWRLQQSRWGDGQDVSFSVKVFSPVESGYPPAGG
jgi:hypothetical protein